MKKQNTAVRRAALAVLYLAVFAAAVMYLRVTISVPAEGDDKLTLNGWLYDMGRMSFWQYALQDLKERLSFFLLKQVRFFPFHYPNAVALLFYRTLASYRLYIIAMTGAAAFLVSRVAAKLSRSNALALGAFGLALAAAPIFNEGMYSYYAVPQRTLLWAAASWLCLFYLHESHHRAWGVVAAVLAFIACGTYETGYVYAVLALLLWVVYTRSVRGGLRASAPVLGGMAVAFCFHFASSRHGGTGNELSLDIPNVARVTVQQMAASIPFLGPWLQGQDCGTISKGDMLWPFVLGLLAVAALLFAVPREKVGGKSLGGLALLGLGLWAAPAALLALGCHLCRTCQTGRCSWGIATQNPELVKRLDIEAGKTRLVNLLTAWKHEIKEMMGGMGINSIEALKGNRLMLRGVGMTDRELEILGIAHAGE